MNTRTISPAIYGVALIAFVTGCSPAAAPVMPQQPVSNVQAAPAAPPPVAAQPETPAAPGGNYEQPPVINVSDLLPASALSGPGFIVQQQVPTNGAMGEYTIVADASVFHNNAGTYQVESLDMLKIRLSEIPAIAQLDNSSQTAIFAQAVAKSAERPISDAANMVVHPMDTVTGLPSGINEFFGRVSLGANQLYATATNSSESGGQRAEQTAEESGSITATALGYEQVRRSLARKLHVDPYSSDPILKAKLNHVAWVMFSARLAVDTVVTVAVPGSIFITGTEFTEDLVYQTPKGDLILLVQKKLKEFGLSQSDIALFTHNTAIPLSLQVTAVHDLDALGPIRGRKSAAIALANVLTEYQARFLVTSIHMLAKWSQQKSPITRIEVPGLIIGRDQNGTTIVPAPVDYLSWTQRIAGFATDPALLSRPNRVLWIPAQMTPLALQQLAANGWKVHQGDQP
ncbi:MAG TPA: hypothetical protein VMA09_16060 [Candidatus Binataceae bacterium]|nr:hypothetical protein [Candidatus Binataceae bacterium]